MLEENVDNAILMDQIRVPGPSTFLAMPLLNQFFRETVFPPFDSRATSEGMYQEDDSYALGAVVPDKENASAKKRTRKSIGKDEARKRVSFGAVKVHHVQKIIISPAREPTLRRSPRSASPAEPESAHDPPAQMSPAPPPPPAESPDVSMQAPPAKSTSPAPSEASDVFFSPNSYAESQAGSPSCGTPSLKGILTADGCADAAVPGLSTLLQQDLQESYGAPNDDDDTQMDMTVAVGGIVGGARASSAPAESPLPPPPADEEDDDMELTGNFGGAKPPRPSVGGSRRLSVAPPPPPPAEEEDDDMELTGNFGGAPSARPPRPSVAGSRRLSVAPSIAEDEPLDDDEVPAPPGTDDEPDWLADAAKQLEAAPAPAPSRLSLGAQGDKRRFSFSGVGDKLAQVGSRVARIFTSAAEEPEPSKPEEEEEEAPAPTATTFDEYLVAAGVLFHDPKVMRSGVSMAPKVPGIGLRVASVEGQEAVADKLMAATVLEGELEQLRWAEGELTKCIGTVQEGYLKMEEYVGENAPGFFSAPEAQVAPAQLKKLKARCRQMARAFWYDWRTTLEADTANKLQAAATCFEQDLSRLSAARAQAAELERDLAAAMPPPEDEEQSASLVAARADASTLLAKRDAALVHAESAVTALQKEVIKQQAEIYGESGLLAQERQAEHRLASLGASLGQSRAAPTASLQAELLGEDLLDALQTALCWTPTVLSSSQLRLTFRDAFELSAALRGPHVSAVTLRATLPTDGAAAAAPHAALLRGLFARVHADLAVEISACRTAPLLASLLQKASLRLGRALDLAKEVEHVSRDVTVDVATETGGGVQLTMPYSFFSVRAKFALVVELRGEEPTTPLACSFQAAPQLGSVASADELRQTVEAICGRYEVGYGRLTAIHEAIGASLRPIG